MPRTQNAWFLTGRLGDICWDHVDYQREIDVFGGFGFGHVSSVRKNVFFLRSSYNRCSFLYSCKISLGSSKLTINGYLSSNFLAFLPYFHHLWICCQNLFTLLANLPWKGTTFPRTRVRVPAFFRALSQSHFRLLSWFALAMIVYEVIDRMTN